MIRRSKENLLIQAKRLLDEYEAVDTNYKTTSIFGLSKDEKYQEYLRKVESNDDFIVFSLRRVPEEYRTPELCKIAVEKNGSDLQFVPENLITPELCKIAVEQYGLELQFVPENLITPELCKIAVESCGLNLRDVPEKYMTPELCKIAVKEAGRSLRYVPENLITPELCMIAVKDDKSSVKLIPEKNVELWLAVCRSYPRLCNYVSEDTLDAMTDEQYEEFKSIRNRVRSCFYR